ILKRGVSEELQNLKPCYYKIRFSDSYRLPIEKLTIFDQDELSPDLSENTGSQKIRARARFPFLIL
ncbi:MAG: hypothetical protein QOH78_590, partial [Verrucomicrobiota bacterium]